MGGFVRDEPQLVKIGPVAYKLIYDDKLAADGALGSISPSRLEIRLATGLLAEREAIVLWHGVLHGILFGAGYTEHDEQMIEALAHGIVAAQADNPGLL